MANSVDPDQMPYSPISDLGLSSVFRGVSVPIPRVVIVSTINYS